MMRYVKISFFLMIITAIAAGTWFYRYVTMPLNLPSKAQQVTIEPNSALPHIARQLVAQGVIKDTLPFILLAHLTNKAETLQAGNFSLDKHITPGTLLDVLQNGKAKQASIRFIEGKTFKVMRQILDKHQAITQTITKLTDQEVLALITHQWQRPEGLFFPDTFYFNDGAKDIELLKTAYHMMQKRLSIAWENRAKNLPYKNSYEALIMASIIEKETGKASERAMIAGVFVNRLKNGMLLQTDPTVIYGMGDKFTGNLRRKDLRTDTRYNTYTRHGLPPTPIAMPGAASIEAALHPKKTKALYFVSKGDGSHHFSNSLAEHNRAVRKYQLKR